MNYRALAVMVIAAVAPQLRAQSPPNTMRFSTRARFVVNASEFRQLDSALTRAFWQAGLRVPPPPPATFAPLERASLDDPITWWVDIDVAERGKLRALILTVTRLATGELTASDSTLAAPRALTDSAAVLAQRLARRIPR